MMHACKVAAVGHDGKSCEVEFPQDGEDKTNKNDQFTYIQYILSEVRLTMGRSRCKPDDSGIMRSMSINQGRAEETTRLKPWKGRMYSVMSQEYVVIDLD